MLAQSKSIGFVTSHPPVNPFHWIATQHCLLKNEKEKEKEKEKGKKGGATFLEPIFGQKVGTVSAFYCL